MSTTASKIREMNLVCIPTPDQDRSIRFYESLGFEKRTDIPFGDKYRWVEVYPPNGTAGLALAPPQSEGGDQTGRETGIAITSDDIDASHAHFKSLNIDVDDQVQRMGDPVPPMFWFRDPNGNSLMVVEPQNQ